MPRGAAMLDDLVTVVKRYLEALNRDDRETLVSLFAPTGRVYSPFLGEMPVREFFDRLGQATRRSVITPLDIMPSCAGNRRVAAFFRYDWTVSDGTLISLELVDLFDFEPDRALIRKLTIVYDTYPVRQEHGNKYER